MSNKLVLVDAHVHIHDCYNINEYLNSVFENFTRIAIQKDQKNNWIGVLLLSEIKNTNYFNKILSNEDSFISKSYSIEKTLEKNSLIISKTNGETIIVVAGKQIITNEGIEVLALGTSSEIPYDKNLGETINKVIELDAIPVMPWGVGKWLGKRKEIIQNFILNSNDVNYFIGDISGRPGFWNVKKIFTLGEHYKHYILVGTDALSIKSEYNKTASYGFYFEGNVDEKKPWISIKASIEKFEDSPKVFGSLEKPINFFKNQIFMQLMKNK